MTQTDGKMYHVHGLEELILLKWPYYPRQSMDVVQFLSNTNGIFHRTRRNNSKICMETQKTPNSQSNLEQEEQSWRYHAPWFQAILQSYSNQNSMVLAQKQTHRSMEQNREPRNEPMLTSTSCLRVYKSETIHYLSWVTSHNTSHPLSF